MNRTVLIIFAAIILLVVVYFLFLKKKKTPFDVDGYFISTQSESNKRVEKLGLDKPSEDASYILDVKKLHIPPDPVEKHDPEYKADPAYEWVIDVQPIGSATFTDDALDKLFDKPWRQEYGSATVYGYASKEKRWTFATAGDVQGPFEKLQVAINLKGVYNDEKPDYRPQKLERYFTALAGKLKSYPFKVTPDEPVGSAITKAKKLVDLTHEFDKDAIIILAGDKPMSGKLVWDALICTGLKWGDGDLFHWGNTRRNYGDDQLFSVWTTTDPGYFLPESIGQMNPGNLVFGFSIPRNADPENVYEAMLNAVRYCQKRLGGKILNQEGKPFDVEKERAALAQLIKKLKARGIVPGSDKALINF